MGEIAWHTAVHAQCVSADFRIIIVPHWSIVQCGTLISYNFRRPDLEMLSDTEELPTKIFLNFQYPKSVDVGKRTILGTEKNGF